MDEDAGNWVFGGIAAASIGGRHGDGRGADEGDVPTMRFNDGLNDPVPYTGVAPASEPAA